MTGDLTRQAPIPIPPQLPLDHASATNKLDRLLLKAPALAVLSTRDILNANLRTCQLVSILIPPVRPRPAHCASETRPSETWSAHLHLCTSTPEHDLPSSPHSLSSRLVHITNQVASSRANDVWRSMALSACGVTQRGQSIPPGLLHHHVQ